MIELFVRGVSERSGFMLICIYIYIYVYMCVEGHRIFNLFIEGV